MRKSQGCSGRKKTRLSADSAEKTTPRLTTSASAVTSTETSANAFALAGAAVRFMPPSSRNQWWNRRMPVNAIAMPYLLQVSITLSSRIEPPGCAMNSTPLLRARSMFVAEREERVAADRNALERPEPRRLLLAGQRGRTLGEELLPCAVAQHVVALVADVDVDRVVAVRAADVRLERQVQHLLVLAEVPDVRLVARKARAVDAALLPAPMPMAWPSFA